MIILRQTVTDPLVIRDWNVNYKLPHDSDEFHLPDALEIERTSLSFKHDIDSLKLN